jgi:hypothetical protein
MMPKLYRFLTCPPAADSLSVARGPARPEKMWHDRPLLGYEGEHERQLSDPTHRRV